MNPAETRKNLKKAGTEEGEEISSLFFLSFFISAQVSFPRKRESIGFSMKNQIQNGFPIEAFGNDSLVYQDFFEGFIMT
jgi:hypothetical protein